MFMDKVGLYLLLFDYLGALAIDAARVFGIEPVFSGDVVVAGAAHVVLVDADDGAVLPNSATIAALGIMPVMCALCAVGMF